MKNLVALVFIGLLANACGHSGPPGPTADRFKHAAIEGGLEETTSKIYNHVRAEACDIKIRETMLSFARDLDTKADEINEFRSAHMVDDSSDWIYHTIGGAKFRERKEKIKGESGWLESDITWDDLIVGWKKVRSQAVDENWVELDYYFRAVLENDRDRILYGKSPVLSRSAEPAIRDALNAVDACFKSELCVLPVPSTDEGRRYMWTGTNYKNYYKYLNDSQASREDKRGALANYREWVASDLAHYGFTKNSAIKLENGVLIVPLVLSAVHEGQDLLRHFLEAPWSVLGHKLTSKDSNESGSYRVVINAKNSGRAFVSRQDKEMNLYDGTNVTSIGHEFGHILGFPDRYYTTWNPDSCTYHDEYSNEDIMSNSAGRVLPEHWQTLLENYGSHDVPIEALSSL